MNHDLHEKQQPIGTIPDINSEQFIDEIQRTEQERKHAHLVEHSDIEPKCCLLCTQPKPIFDTEIRAMVRECV